MAYRLDTSFTRGFDVSDDSFNASSFHLDSFHPDAGPQFAALSPVISPNSVSLDIPDFALRTVSPFQHDPFAHHGGDGMLLSGSPTDLDTVAGDTTTTATLNVMEGQAIDGTINVAGTGTPATPPSTDADWYKVTLTAGQTYEFHLTQADQSSTGPDFKLGIYDASGTLIQENDNGGMGAPEELHITAASSGTYYISASNYTAADLGDYTISGNIDNDSTGTGGTPLAAIDWGGPATKMYDDNPDDGVTHIKVYYGKAGEFFGSPDDPVVSVGWDDFAKAATFVAFQQYEHVVNVEFDEVADSADADWVICQTVTAPVLLGEMRPPGEENAGVGDFNKAGADYDEASCAQGGYSYITFIHEFGHGMGMSHPHDTGGGSEVMHGVTGDVADGYTTGDFGLNEGIYTTMSYNDGWPDGPEGTSDSTAYGYQGTLMALDVAMMQLKYGANEHYRTGDNVYKMPDVNAPGTMYACLWDAGGNDTIKAQGHDSSTIDLRPATLQYELGGGGWVSHTAGIFGGFTIANGVVIENARGAGGDDIIVGNDAANHLTGGGGLDTIDGGDGNDVIDGGWGMDQLTGGAGDDTFVFSSNRTGHDTITDLDSGDTIDLSGMDGDTMTDGDQGFTIVAHFDGNAGEMIVRYVSASDVTQILMDTNGDGHRDHLITIMGNHAGFDNFGF